MHSLKQSGMTMIEVLITILVLAIGLTGVMSMEAIAIKTNHQAYLRTQVILQAQEMADRMHANLQGATDLNYVMAETTTALTEPTPNCLSAACTPAQIAAFDEWEWDTANKALLPSSTAEITYNSDTDKKYYTITIKWQEDTNDALVTKSFSFIYKPLTIYAL